MRVNVNLYWILGIFFFIAAAAYTIWSLLYYGKWEPVGTLGIALTGVLMVFVAFYLGRVLSSQGGSLPEDRGDANIEDGDAELGHFSPWSWWPIFMAAAVSIIFLGVAAGTWMCAIGAALLAVALVGWTYEYYRGNFGH